MLEIIAMTVEDAKRIEACGADRIELVSALTEGGLTPSYSIIESVIKNVEIPVNVMVRHHAKSFNYTDAEIEIMAKDIEVIKKLGANGVVLGVLNEEHKISEKQLAYLIESCEGLDVTFHKAIDECDVLESLATLKKYPTITNILTGGGLGLITDNIETLSSAVENSGHINILIGGGLTHENVLNIKSETNATDFHFGTAVRIDKSPFGEIDEVALQNLVEKLKE